MSYWTLLRMAGAIGFVLVTAWTISTTQRDQPEESPGMQVKFGK